MMRNLIFWGQAYFRKAQNILEIGPGSHNLNVAAGLKPSKVNVAKRFRKGIFLIPSKLYHYEILDFSNHRCLGV